MDSNDKRESTMRLRILGVTAVMMIVVGACVPATTNAGKDVCGEKGEEVRTSEAGPVCVYREDDIVVETGFSCPATRSNRYDRTLNGTDYVVCADESELGAGTFDEIAEKLPDEFEYGGEEDDEWKASEKLDLLWVIDNSGSMCEEQESLRNNFAEMVETLDERPLDFHMSVTTTQYESGNSSEGVAEPGRLQSTPHPPPGFFDECRGDPSNNYEPLKEQLRAAVQCTKNPDEFQDLLNPSEDRLRCAVDGECGAVPEDSLRVAELFPCANAKGSECTERSEFADVYRDIPKVLRAEEYRQPDGTLDLDELRRDFACMSFVGTGGTTFEQGLRAAVRAVHPEMTGGPVEDPQDPEAPNHGFVRSDANFAVTFVSDENDCSYREGARDQISGNGCGQLNCYFPTKEQPQDPLIPTDDLYSDFLSNLAASKGLDAIDRSEVLAASLHGNYQRYSGEVTQMCSAREQRQMEDQLDVCNTSRGTAKSGDRYADFIGNFANHVPQDEKKGFMCDAGSLQEPLEQIAGFVRNPE